MRGTSAWILVLGLSVSGCEEAEDRLTDEQTVAIADGVATAMDRFRTWSAEARWDSVGLLYSDSPGFRFFESGALQYESAAAVREALASLPAGMTISTVYRDTRVQPLAAGTALVSAAFETTFDDGSGGGFGFSGVVTLVWVNEAGRWRILSGHTSVPVPRGG